MASNTPSSPRYPFVDQIRGMAVLLMIVFHTAYDLKLFGHLSIDFQKEILWWAFPRLIVFLFLLAMGLSLSLAHPRKVRWSAFGRRWGKLAFCAGLVSLCTYFLFPTQWIYFGTLHCIMVCGLMALPLLRTPRLAGLLGGVIFLPLLWGLEYPWFRLKHTSMDYIPPFPWISVVLLGIWGHSLGWHRIRPPKGPLGRILALLGRFSLGIYLVHQPIIYGLCFLGTTFF